MRGFDRTEFQARCKRAQDEMQKADLAALLLTTEPEVRYFTGFLTRFWESPTRPWYLVVPASGAPIAVIPSIGQALMSSTWVEDIRCWTSPDLNDDGISLLAETLCEHTSRDALIGLPGGHETHIRMPHADLEKLKGMLEHRTLVGDNNILRSLRMVKSQPEIAKIETACGIATRAFERVPEIAAAGISLEKIFRRFQMLCLDEGADWVPYLAGGAGPGGYADVISPARPHPLTSGDVMMLDTGLVFDGYFCDFDRNWSVGRPSSNVSAAHSRLVEAVTAGAEAARPGRTASDVFHAINKVLNTQGESTDAGRLGHGLGMSLTEWPSLIAEDHTVLQEGMVLTLEPGIAVANANGRVMVHEENIVITSGAPRFLSQRSTEEILQL